MQPEHLMASLRDFHQRMEAEVFAHSGTLEKYIGDALFATFGVPRQGNHDATDALACAAATRTQIDEWNQE